jgi:hypothetical protein
MTTLDHPGWAFRNLHACAAEPGAGFGWAERRHLVATVGGQWNWLLPGEGEDMVSVRGGLIAAALFLGLAYHFVSPPSDTKDALPALQTTPVTKPVALASLEQPAALIAPAPASTPAPLPNKPTITREQAAAAALSAGAIAALIVEVSRQQYYAAGHPCACPDDMTRAGRRCGNMSAYSRPGGAAPLCHVSDVSAEMIAQYRSRMSARN